MSATPIVHPSSAGAELWLRIGQRVRHVDFLGKRVTGVVRSLSVDQEQGLLVGVALDTPIIIESLDDRPEIKLWHQHAQAHEFVPFDERDEQIEELLGSLQALIPAVDLTIARKRLEPALLKAVEAARATVAKCTGGTTNTREQDTQHVLKAKAETPDATDRGAPASAGPGGGPMGAGQSAAADPIESVA